MFSTRLAYSQFLTLTLCSVLLITGCAYQTVSHLKKKPWNPDTTEVLDMDYLRFEYMARNQEDSLRVTGVACPKRHPIPGWADWIDDMWLATYLSDDTGRVLARKFTMITPRELDYDQCIDFDFTLEPQDVGQPGPVYVSFGYRMVLTAHPYAADDPTAGDLEQEKDVFFASESALSRF